ncbi:MAG TPA: protein kinase [Ktedonobacteraceae bacterium]|nr:protein kinase [Ktedonobacteraceae bacterium]
MLSLEGQQLGNYDITRRIRVGGMGAVYEGRQRTAFDRRVAIKVILGDYATDRDMRRRFAREARTIARLHHPHILPLIEFGDEKGILYLVMPFIEGGTLTSYLRRSLPGLDDVVAIYAQLLDAVEYAHDEGLIHRDIKSSNVLMDLRHATPHAYLADFGLVRTTRQLDNSQTGKPIPLDQVPGTPHYMAPEQTRGIVTPSTDIYALGVLLYQMLTGELPYNDPDDVRVIQMHLHDPIPSPCDQDASIPAELGVVVQTAMAKQPEDRYHNVAELRDAFRAAINGPVPATPDEERSLEQVEQLYIVEPPSRHPSPAPLYLQEPAAPPVSPRRQRNEAPQTAIRERPRNTDTVRPRQRITEEPMKRPRRRRRLSLSLLVAVLVPLLLMSLLIVPRVLGFSLLPVGVPIFGAPPIATIYVTAQSKVLQDSYVLTASPQVQQPDLVAHTIPDRLLKGNASGNSTVQTTGTRTIAGVAARGTIVFLNDTASVVTVPVSQTIATPSGVRFQLLQALPVPARQGGTSGLAQATAVAVTPGVVGNIPAHALDGMCCNNMLTIKNLAPFVGGSDSRLVHLVAQADLDGVQTALIGKLQQQIGQQIQKSLTADEILAGVPTFAVSVTANSPVGTQTNQVQVTVNVTGNVAAYNHTVANNTAIQLLIKRADQTLDKGYQMQGQPTITTQPTVVQGKDGTIYLSVPVKGLWNYILSGSQMAQWRQSIKGATAPVATAYLNAQPGVASVQISLPFGADHLPTTPDDIRIVVVS